MKKLFTYLFLILFCSTLSLNSQITLNPVKEVNNKNATKEVKELYNYFLSVYGKHIISGQTEFQYCEFVSGVTGRSPVICAFDFMDFTWDKSLTVDKAIEWSKDHKGIVAFQWHWRDPMTKNGEFYSYPNYQTGTKFDVSKIFSPESPEYKAMIDDIDLISSHLKRLQDNNIPVLWRPLHEATGNQWGGWFWWSTGTSNPAASCKKLWEVMYDRMTNYHGLNNLIWIWNTEGTAREDAWYPGDSTVDLLGTDTYNGTINSTWANRFEAIHLRHNGTKMIAMTENGSVPDSRLLLEEKVPWLYFCTWGNMIMDQELNPRDVLRRVFNDPYVITNSKLNVDTIPDPVNKPTLPDAYEAEDAILSGTLKVYKVYDGYTGRGYVGNFSGDNDKITFLINSDEAGVNNLFIAYHITKGWGDKYTHIKVNNGNQVEVRFENKDDEGFHETPPLSINLNKGQNEIVLLKNWGYYEIDYIRIPKKTTNIDQVSREPLKIWIDGSFLKFDIPSDEQISNIEFFSIDGRLVYNLSNLGFSDAVSIPISIFSKGVHIVKITTSKEVFSYKVNI